jgi:hypothetical protein
MKVAWFVIACGVVSAAAPVAAAPAHAKVLHAAQAKPAAKSGKAAAHAAPARRVRKVAVEQFDAPADSRARYGVLNELSDHDDVEVVSLDDIHFVAKRFKLGAETPEGRVKISAELGIQLWIDGEASSDSAELKLTKPDGKVLVETEVNAPSEKLLESLTGERVWATMGPQLSAREQRRRALLAQSELAHQKLEARELELEHQRKLALEAKQQAKIAKAAAEAERKQKLAEAERDRQKKLEAQQALAVQKRAALLGYLSRQTTLAEERKAEHERMEQAAHRAQLAAAAATKQHELAVKHGRAQAPLGAQAQETGAYMPPAAYGSGYANSSYAGGYAQPSSSRRPVTGISPATQRWLQQQQYYAPPQHRAQAPSMVPARPGYAANGGVSPATQRWLSEQQSLR